MGTNSEDQILYEMGQGSIDMICRMVRVIEECQDTNPRAARDARKALRKTIEHRRHIPAWGPLPVDLQEQVERLLQEHKNATTRP